ncbi:MAG TPA: FtsX-like permease family protein [Planctomycetaceae bacterium]|nr:FtsX-like permease family protein [Planctomycetaceae bacterium]
MNLFAIALKSIRQRWLASTLTSLSVALSIMLMVLVLILSSILEKNFDQRSLPPYELIAGPKGSSLQLVLNTIYRIGNPEAYLPYQYYLELQKDPRIQHAVPITMGDVTEEGGFKIIGTTSLFFELGYAENKPFLVRGKRFGTDFDAIIGADVARTNNWDLGSQFKLVHGGLEMKDTHTHEEKFTVVAVLARTGTANDKTVFVNIEGFFAIGGHDKPIEEAIAQHIEFYGEGSLSQKEIDKLIADERAEQAAHANEGEGGHAHHHAHETPIIKKNVTAVFVQLKPKMQMAGVLMEGKSKKGYKAQFVNPITPVRMLMDSFVGTTRFVLMILTGLIIAVSGMGIFVSIYNSMADRKREIAIMRALGARRQTVFAIVLAESILLCIGGGALGLLLGHGLIYFSASTIEVYAGILVDPLAFEPLELVLFPILLGLAALIGFLPGMTAYRTDVADSLSN